MRIGIVTDSTCDLSPEYLISNNIIILPITIKYGNEVFIDTRDEKSTRNFTDEMFQKSLDCESAPFSQEEIKNLFLKKLVLDYDYVICVTVSSSRSLIYENAKLASLSILNEYREIREKAGIKGAFNIRVIDSQQLFTGQAAVVAEAINILNKGGNALQTVEGIIKTANYTQAFLVPSNLNRLRFQARKKGDNSVSLMGYMIGSALDIKPIIRSFRGKTEPVVKVKGFESGVEKVFNLAQRQIVKGLMSKHVCISYGGNIQDIKRMPGFENLYTKAREYGIRILISEMSATAIVNIGPGSLGLAFVSQYDEKL